MPSRNPTTENDGHVGPEEKESLAAVIKTAKLVLDDRWCVPLNPHQQTLCRSAHGSSAASAVVGTTAEKKKTRVLPTL